MFKSFIKRNKSEIVITTLVFAIVAGGMICSRPKKSNTEVKKVYSTAEQSAPEPDTTPAEPQKIQTEDITVIATAYCPCVQCCGKSDGITATGTKATQGRTIAADPNVLPYGTELIIDGVVYVVEDCGGAIKGNRIDIYFDTHAEALQFGRRTLNATIIKRGGIV